MNYFVQYWGPMCCSSSYEGYLSKLDEIDLCKEYQALSTCLNTPCIADSSLTDDLLGRIDFLHDEIAKRYLALHNFNV